jgi:ribosomal protein L37AE/L43A
VECPLGQACALPECDPWCHYDLENGNATNPLELRWCPECDRETKHRRLSVSCVECTVCLETTADIVSVPCPVDSPA